MQLIDLSHSLFHNMPVYPDDTPVSLIHDKHFESDQYNNFILETGMHVGTHIDSPMHLTDSTRFIADIPLHRFTGNGCLLDARGQKRIIDNDTYRRKVKKDAIVLICTGFSLHYGTKKYYEEYPILDTTFAQLLIDNKVKMVGIDTPSPDYPPFEIHKQLLTNGILIIENLTNLEQLFLYHHFEVIAFPLKIHADSSLVRVAAKINSECNRKS